MRDDELLSIEDAFGHSLFGFVVGGFVEKKTIDELIKSWKVPCTFTTHNNGWIVFTFGIEEEKRKALENGPYTTLGRQWMIKEIPPTSPSRIHVSQAFQYR